MTKSICVYSNGTLIDLVVEDRVNLAEVTVLVTESAELRGGQVKLDWVDWENRLYGKALFVGNNPETPVLISKLDGSTLTSEEALNSIVMLTVSCIGVGEATLTFKNKDGSIIETVELNPQQKE